MNGNTATGLVIVAIMIAIVVFGVDYINTSYDGQPTSYDNHQRLITVFKENGFMLGQAQKVVEDGVITNSEYEESMELYTKLSIEHLQVSIERRENFQESVDDINHAMDTILNLIKPNK